MPRALFIVGLLMLLGAWALGATPANYTGSNNGNWSLATNWSTNPTVPLNSGPATYDVTINGKSVTFNVSGSNAINSLGLTSATLKLNAGDNLSVVSGLTASVSTVNAIGSAFSA